MQILTRDRAGRTTELVSIEHEGIKYCVVLRSFGRNEVLRPDCSAVRRNSKLARDLVALASAPHSIN